MLSNNIN